MVVVLLFLLLVAPLSAAPAAPVTSLSKPVQGVSLEQRVQRLEHQLKAMSNMLLRLDTVQREVQQLRGEVELQNHAVDALKQRQRDLYLDIDQRLGRFSGQTPVVPVMPAAVSETPEDSLTPADQEPVVPALQAPSAPFPDTPSVLETGDPALEQSTYQEAFNMLMQRRYGEARQAFTAFLAKYPSGKFSDNAQYWLAEASYVIRDFDIALVDFTRVVERYPESRKIPDALLKTGFIQYEKKQWGAARKTLEEITGRYAGSTASQLAHKRLKRMSAEGH